MQNVLYTVIVYPLIQIIELIFVAFDGTFYAHGASIIGASIVCTTVCLPLYIIADKRQREEINIEKKIAPGIKQINSTFRGKERSMMRASFYRENKYNPIMTIRLFIGLLLQIPFFLAAFMFIPRLQQLKGASFFCIKDLGIQDKILHIGNLSVNILPVILLIVCITATYIYMKEFRLRDKLFQYGVAIIFFAILYRQPAGLVLYWIIENCILLVKNIFYKLRNPLKILYFTLIAALVALDSYFIVTGKSISDSGSLIALSIIIPLTPFFLRAKKSHVKNVFDGLIQNDAYRTALFMLSACVLCILTGFTTTTNVIVSSPQEFSFVDMYTTPTVFVWNTLLQSVGFFLFWPIIIYLLFSRRIQSVLSTVTAILSFSALLNAFLFPGHYGIISPLLIFESEDKFSPGPGLLLLNIASIILVIVAVVLLLRYRKHTWLTMAVALFSVSLTGVGIKNIADINQSFTQLAKVYHPKQNTKVDPVFHFSKTGKNVFVIMLDRAINGFFPTIMNEDPELKSVYSGFTYYPNTVSFGFFTLEGAPALYGGYEYTPLEMNKRNKKSLVCKHDEALAVLPRIFSKNGFETTMADAPWANYSWISDMSYMHKYPEKINTIHTERTYKAEWYAEHGNEIPHVQSTLDKRNFIWYGIMKDAPLFLRKAIYNDGDWWASANVSSRNNLFLDSYSVLDFLPRLTATDAKGNTFTYMDNDTTHDPVLCQAPNYVPVEVVTNRGTTQFASSEHYHGNAAAIHRIGDWIKYLKAEGVYDNTRIIISADHGRNVYTGQFAKEKKLPFMREFCHPLLLVKDFGATGDVKTDNTFMTNADVPTLAVQGVIQNPINPFTGKLITSTGRKKLVTITSSKNWMPAENNKNTLSIAPNEWFTVHDNIFDENNWAPVKIKQAKDAK